MASVEHALKPGVLRNLFQRVLGPEGSYYNLAVIYGIAFSVLTLAVPISVQMLIDTVANTALVQPLVVLSAVLLVLLLVSGLLYAFRTHLMELFERRIYARLTSEVALRAMYARATFFDETQRTDLFNRYFDIMTLQRYVPSILIGAVSLIFQAVFGIAVVSLYHPALLIFNVAFVLLIWLVWAVWGRGAIRTGLYLSESKYNTARWLEGLASNNSFFKSDQHISFALSQADDFTNRYMTEKKRHFRFTFAQTVALLLLYAIASAGLLGIGGWLVIIGELTLGQLVAAELIMSAIFVGVSQFSSYLRQFYDVCAAVEELSRFFDMPLEQAEGSLVLPDGATDLTFNKVRLHLHDKPVMLDMVIPGGANLRAEAEDFGLQRIFTYLMKRHIVPNGGSITLGGQDLMDCDVHRLRQDVVVLHRSNMMESRIVDYLRLSHEGVTRADMVEALDMVGLDEVISALEDGLNTTVGPSGLPLSDDEAMRLKLAAAILSRPHVLVLTQQFDLVDGDHMNRVIAYLDEKACTTVVYFTQRRDIAAFTHNLFLSNDEQRITRLDAADAPAGDQGENNAADS